MQKCAFVATVAMLTASGARAQQVEPALYGPALVASADARVLPANSEVVVSLNEELNSKTARQGKVFDVSVSRDVMAGGYVVIPRGTRGLGEVVYRTGRGAFGKSGKMEIKLQSVPLGGRSVPLGGRFRQEGEGNTGATVGAVLAAGVIAGAFVTGRSAVFEQGREFRGYTLEAVDTGLPRAMTVAALPMAKPAAFVAPMQTPVAFAPVVSRPRPIVSASVAVTDYDRALAAQQGVHGRQPQGWSIGE